MHEISLGELPSETPCILSFFRYSWVPGQLFHHPRKLIVAFLKTPLIPLILPQFFIPLNLSLNLPFPPPQELP